MKICIDGAKMTDRSAAHAHLAEQLGFPEYYGNNLDALYDLLTERGEETLLCLENSTQMMENLGPYGGALRSTLFHAALHNPALEFVHD